MHIFSASILQDTVRIVNTASQSQNLFSQC